MEEAVEEAALQQRLDVLLEQQGRGTAMQALLSQKAACLERRVEIAVLAITEQAGKARGADFAC